MLLVFGADLARSHRFWRFLLPLAIFRVDIETFSDLYLNSFELKGIYQSILQLVPFPGRFGQLRFSVVGLNDGAR